MPRRSAPIWLERESPRLANPPEVFAAFEQGWLLLNPEHEEEPGEGYERFLAIVASWPGRC